MLTSPSNPRVKHLAQLIKKSSLRRSEDVFIAEGLRLCREIPKEALVELFVSESFYAALDDNFKKAVFKSPMVLSDDLFAKISDTVNTQGILAVARQRHFSLTDILKAPSPLVLVLEHVQDPGNIGTILRSAEAAGVCGIILDRDCADCYNPKTVRATMGSIFRMPFVYTDDLALSINTLKQNGLRVFAADLESSEAYFKKDFTAPCAIMIGNEANGLSDRAVALADASIHIPMHGKVESLNAAAAAAILMHEAARQRYLK